MNRHPRVRFLALLLPLLILAGCSRDNLPVTPAGDRNAAATRASGGGRLGGPLGEATTIDYEAILVFAENASVGDFLAQHDLKEVSNLKIEETTYYLVTSNDGSPIEEKGLADDPAVLLASPHNRVWIPEADRGGLSFDDQDSWRDANAYEGQDVFTRIGIKDALVSSHEDGEVIAILDSGFDFTHTLFAGASIVEGLDYTESTPRTGIDDVGNGLDDDGDGRLDDGVGHGTHVAGIVHAGAPRAQLLIHRVLDDEGWGTAFGLVEAAKDAVDKGGAHVINMSLGLTTDDPMIRHLVAWIGRSGVALVASAGNRDSSEPQYPAAYPDAISVTAVDDGDIRAPFASYGVTVDVSAPGVDVISAISSWYGPNRYAVASGTSMATPFVTAAVAIAHARWPQVSPRDAGLHVVAKAVSIDALNPAYAGLLGRGRVHFMTPIQVAP